jgi:hypothetical protein
MLRLFDLQSFSMLLLLIVVSSVDATDDSGSIGCNINAGNPHALYDLHKGQQSGELTVPLFYEALRKIF